MEVCYWALLFLPLVILHHLLNVFVQLANKRGFTKKKKFPGYKVKAGRNCCGRAGKNFIKALHQF
jgi:hypothetical protein